MSISCLTSMRVWELSNSRWSASFRLFLRCLSDHIPGLTAAFNDTLYCSEITRRLLLQQFRALADVVVTLELNEPTLILLGDGCRTATVTAFDANHCPGSVMFLFQGAFGSILCTGNKNAC